MPKRTLLILLFLLTQIFSTAICYASQSKTNTNFLSGYVWQDVNNNGIQELTEETLPHTTVHIQSSSNSNIITVVTDALGYFVVSGLENGRYVVWCEHDDVTTEEHVIDVADLMGAATIGIPMHMPSGSPVTAAAPSQPEQSTQLPRTIYLPLVRQ